MQSYNQKVERKQFNSEITEQDWINICNSCDGLLPLDPAQAQPHCEVCVAYSPVETTYYWYDIYVYLGLGVIFFLVLRLFVRRK